jgi:glucosamine--fructose-6-phosphate aminotransferase (isomerizing)
VSSIDRLVLGFVEHAIDAIFLCDEEMVFLDSKGLHLCNFYGASMQPSITKLAREVVNVEKGDFAHFTVKEIFEQPTTFKRVDNSSPEFELLSEYLRYAGNVYITGSGTSYNAALVGCYLLRKYAKINAEPLVASEVPFLPLHFDRQSVVLALSQSGESADVLNAVHIAKKTGAKIVSIVNVTTSSLARESSVSIGLNCGPEIGVAATKSFTSQLGILYRLAEKLSGLAFRDFSKVAESMGEILLAATKVEEIARELRNVNDIYVLGRGIHFPIAIEGALKIKEITYIHAEGVSGGELKHGPLAMMHDGVYVILINPNDSTYVDTLAGGNEIKARGAKIIGISDVPNRVYDRWIKIPTLSDALYPIVEAVPFQLLAYYAAVERNADPDYPRNLAKCVTVK